MGDRAMHSQDTKRRSIYYMGWVEIDGEMADPIRLLG